MIGKKLNLETNIFPCSSDIDLVVVGLWESLPLRTLERRLLERNIADPATIKVNISHRKIVEISSTFVNVLE